MLQYLKKENKYFMRKNVKFLKQLDESRNIQMMINLIANLVSFAVTLGISFFLSPYIVQKLGAEANGFITLANNFISYATLVKTALNSVGSRYIIVSYHRGEIDKVNKYYSSLFFGDLIIGIASLCVGLAFIFKLENLINIPNNIVFDTKMLFFLVFCNFSFNTIAAVFSSAPYIKNKIYLQSIRDIQCNVIRAILLVVLFSMFRPRIFYLGIGTIVSGLILIVYNYIYKCKLVPELKVHKKNFSWSSIKELLGQGIWSSVSSLGEMLLSSFDLLIANLFINVTEMGILSVAKSIPNMIAGIGQTMASVFFPEMTICYAKNDTKGLVTVVKQSCMIIGAIVTIPLAYLIVFGSEFYGLWQPTLDSEKLQILSILTCAGFILCAGCNSISTIFTVTLHLQENALSVLITGIINTVLTLIFVKTTNIGIYAVAGVSSVVETIRMLTYIVPNATKYVGVKITTFYPVIIKSFISTLILCVLGLGLKQIVFCDTWMKLIIMAVAFGTIGLCVNFFIMLDKSARNRVLQKIRH